MQIVILTTNTDPTRQVRYLGPYQIAWWMRSQGYSVQVLDYLYFMSKEQRLDLFRKFITKETKIVGYAPFATLGIQRFWLGDQIIFDIIDEVKENFPWVKFIIGGAWAGRFISQFPHRQRSKVDAVFKKESEHSFLDYADHVFKNTNHPPFYLKNNYKIIDPSKEYDIEKCGMVFSENDFVLPGESLPMEFSRGCIFKCKFCQYPNIGKDKDDFNRSIELIEKSLITNYKLFGTTRYHITDDTLNSHRERTRKFHEMTKRLPFKIEFVGYVRIDLLDIWPEQVEILPESGLISCHFGIETFDPDSCKMIGKGWGAKNNKKWLNYLSEKWGDSMIINCSMIAGLGKETEKQWEESNQWFLESKIHDWFFNPLNIMTDHPQSDLEKNPEKYGYKILEDGSWESEHSTEKKAIEWCNQNRSYFDQRIASVWNFSAWRNMGFTKEQILQSNYIELNDIRTKENFTQNLINSYHSIAMNY